MEKKKEKRQKKKSISDNEAVKLFPFQCFGLTKLLDADVQHSAFPMTQMFYGSNQATSTHGYVLERNDPTPSTDLNDLGRLAITGDEEILPTIVNSFSLLLDAIAVLELPTLMTGRKKEKKKERRKN